jgi:hypothetical protein
MASGILGQADLSATTNTTVYTVPADKVASCIINIVNRGSIGATVRIALSATGTPSAAEWIEYDVGLSPTGILERGGIVLNATKNIVAYSSTANVSVSVYGFEE